MTTQHTLLVDGYNVGDRLLEGAMFKVIITESDGDFTINRVEAPDNTRRGVAYSEFFDDIRHEVQQNLDYLRKYAASQGRTLVQEFDKWEKDAPGEPRIELLNEV